MVKKTLPPLLILLLLFVSMVCSSDAVPMPRLLKMLKDDHQQVLQDVYAQDVMVMKTKGFEERRMVIEITDYAETGANNHHDP